MNQVAYVQASTDDQMREWWASVPHVNFANQLGDDFGAHESAFACGIGLLETCPFLAALVSILETVQLDLACLHF